jgi:hypothetical protein
MKSFGTSLVAVAAVAALSWTGVSRADDDTTRTDKDKDEHTSGQTTTTTTTTDTQDSSSTSGTDPSTDTAGPTTGTDTTGSTTTTDTDAELAPPTSSDTSDLSPYDVYPPATSSTTTTTASSYDPSVYDANVGADRSSYSVRPNRPLLITGAGIFAATYGASVIAGAASDTQGDKNLYIPVVGPWIDMAERECGIGDCGSREDVNQALLIGSGVLQSVGVGLAVASLFIPEKREVSTTATARERSLAATKPNVKILPISVRAGGGFGAVGTF